VFVDLRDGLSHLLLAGSPWSEAPFERDEQAIMRRLVRPGDVVWDIGAHVGIHTVLLCSLATARGRVHAFEANPMRYRALAKTVRLLPNAVLHCCGLGSASGSMPLFVPEDQTMASLADFTRGRLGPVVEVRARIERADDLLSTGRISAPQFIKCDVEGAEYDVFTGAAQAVDRADAPIILYEANSYSAVAFGRELASATLLLKGLRHPQYQIYWVQPGGTLCPIDVPGPPGEHFNLLAVPRARREWLSSITVGEQGRKSFE
jgi:FkbM family methyltransferase